MTASNAERWEACVAHYREFESKYAKDDSKPNMIRLIEHLRMTGDVSSLWPLTSMSWLCVSKIPHWDRKAPFFSLGAYGDETFQIQSYERIARPIGPELRHSFEETVETFWQLAEAL